MRSIAPLVVTLLLSLIAGCAAQRSTTGGPSSSIRGESTISIGTYGNMPVGR